MHMTTILVPFMKVVLMKMLTYLQPFIYASIADQKRSSMPSGEKEVDVVIRKFINDNLQPASEEEYCRIYCRAP